MTSQPNTSSAPPPPFDLSSRRKYPLPRPSGSPVWKLTLSPSLPARTVPRNRSLSMAAGTSRTMRSSRSCSSSYHPRRHRLCFKRRRTSSLRPSRRSTRKEGRSAHVGRSVPLQPRFHDSHELASSGHQQVPSAQRRACQLCSMGRVVSCVGNGYRLVFIILPVLLLEHFGWRKERRDERTADFRFFFHRCSPSSCLPIRSFRTTCHQHEKVRGRDLQ